MYIFTSSNKKIMKTQTNNSVAFNEGVDAFYSTGIARYTPYIDGSQNQIDFDNGFAEGRRMHARQIDQENIAMAEERFIKWVQKGAPSGI